MQVTKSVDVKVEVSNDEVIKAVETGGPLDHCSLMLKLIRLLRTDPEGVKMLKDLTIAGGSWQFFVDEVSAFADFLEGSKIEKENG